MTEAITYEETNKLTTKITYAIERPNGEQIKMVATAFDTFNFKDIDFYVLYKHKTQKNWSLASKEEMATIEDFKNSGLKSTEYVEWYKKYGRSEQHQKIRHSEAFAVIGLIGKPVKEVNRILKQWTGA